MNRKRPAHTENKVLFNRSTIVFVTVCSKGRKPILAHEDVHQCLLNAWEHADGWLVGKYIILPDHIHMFCSPREDEARRLGAWVKYWKALASRAWPRPSEQPVWQRDFWDRQLRQGEVYELKSEYVQSNALRHGFVAEVGDWPFRGEMNQLLWEEIR
ncbi:MAG: hypothetical protein IT363_14655 [Methanoregulaceae archaeon]|jgi:REP element-mobilizing transposase RayT|nr:hypothetical protein [Methanoregulaceae archaeon]